MVAYSFVLQGNPALGELSTIVRSLPTALVNVGQLETLLIRYLLPQHRQLRPTSADRWYHYGSFALS